MNRKSILSFLFLSFSILFLQGCEDPDITNYRKKVESHNKCIAESKNNVCDKANVKEEAFASFSEVNNRHFYTDPFSDSPDVSQKNIDKINLSYLKSLLLVDDYDKLASVFYTVFEEVNLSAVVNKAKSRINNGIEDDMSKNMKSAISKLVNNAEAISLENRAKLGMLLYKNIMFEEALYVLAANNYPPLDEYSKNALMNIINNTCSAEDSANWYYYLTTITTSASERSAFILANKGFDIETKYLNQAKKETSEAISERRLPHFYSERCAALMTKKQFSNPYNQ